MGNNRSRLIEKMELHDTLNPQLWSGEELRPEVKEAIDSIVDHFILELGENEIPVKVLDARIVGSNASFNYTENSDIDVHLVVNTTESSCDFDVLTLLYNFFKKSFNDKYDISIHGIPVEMYIEDVNSSAISNGIYSVFKEEWIKFPEPIEVPDIDITDAFAPFEERYNEIINSNDLTGAEEIIDDLYLLRKDSISVDGEYGEGNLVFKEFRNRGYLDNLKQMMTDLTSKELSLENLNEELQEEVDSIGNALSDDQSSFFKNSKVRDSSGNLMPVFHGTKDNFTVFKHGQKNKYDSGYLGDGFYFTDSPNSAKEYADWKHGDDNNAHIMEVYLNITNPLIIESKQWATVDLQDALGLDLLSDDQKFDFKVNKDVSNKLSEEVKKRGYDGIIYYNNYYKETTFVVFNPNQIKAVTNITPNASSDDINESRDSEEPTSYLEEDLFTVDWAKEQFANAFKKYTPSDTLLQAKLKDITEGEWEDLLDFINSLKFPLVIYRGLKLSDISDFDRNDIGTNWTVDEELFFAPESAFSGSNYVIAAVVDEEQIDWGETIQNYIYYSLRPSDGRWAESEVTLKPNFVLNKMIMLKKQNDELVPVEESLLSEDYLDDEERFWDYKTADVNGTEIFDTSRQETSYGEKFIRLADTGKTDSQGRKSKIVQMSPQEYFLACADGFGSSYSAQIRQVADDEEQLQVLNDVIDKYHKRFPLTYLDYSGISFGQEGRHRMYVAGENFGWDTKHPVLIIYKGDAPNSKQHKDEHEFNKRIKKIYQDSDKYKITDDELIDYLDLDDLEI